MKFIFIILFGLGVIFTFFLGLLLFTINIFTRIKNTLLGSKYKEEIRHSQSCNNSTVNNETVIIEGEIVKDTFIEEYINSLRPYIKSADSDLGDSLSSLISRLKDMDEYIRNHSDKSQDIQVLCDHYIPELINHLNTYSMLETSNFKASNVEAVKQDLLETINMIKEAFTTILSELYENEVLNVSASLEALKASIKMKGLAK